ncbi:MAG: nitroreductase family protein [Promethearchaeati archaeon SRVP18_Atabeyarchaeia-1]
MDVLEAILSRRSIRKFKKDKPVEEEKLQKVLDACRAAPSAHNRQPWEFIVITSKEALKAISKETAYGQFLASAPMGVAIVLDPKVSPDQYMVDGGIVSQNFALAAYGLGLGTCWVGTMNRDKVKGLLGIPAEKYLLTVLPLGYPDGNFPAIPRKPLKDVLYYEKYDQRNRC